MSTKISVNEEIHTLASPINPLNPFVIEEQPLQVWRADWSIFQADSVRVWVYDFEFVEISGGNLYAKHSIVFGDYYAYLRAGCGGSRAIETPRLFYRFSPGNTSWSITPTMRCRQDPPEPKCRLLVNHIDGLQTDLGIIPCDAEIKIIEEEKECPPETCVHLCSDSGLNCCYNESGTLIHSFTTES